jgi:hypothetical protein
MRRVDDPQWGVLQMPQLWGDEWLFVNAFSSQQAAVSTHENTGKKYGDTWQAMFQIRRGFPFGPDG